MPITDLQVAAVRALLVQDFARHEELLTELGEQGVRTGYYPLVVAAFGLAVRDRFAVEGAPDPDEWLSSIDIAQDGSSPIDSVMGRKLIDWVLGKGSNGLEFSEQFPQLTMLLGLLMDEQRKDDAELDAFLRRARKHADWVAEQHDR